MKFIEVSRPIGMDGICSDDKCPCGLPGTIIPQGSGYLYIAPEVVKFRQDALTIDEADAKFEKMNIGIKIAFELTPKNFTPILMCEQGAKKRGLDLKVANEDAKHWWETGLAPLRETPLIETKNISDETPSTEIKNIPDKVSEKTFEDLIKCLPVVDESILIKRWENINPEEELDGVKIHSIPGVIKMAEDCTKYNNSSFSELVNRSRIKEIYGIKSIFSTYRWSQGESINDRNVQFMMGIPGYGTDTLLIARIDEDTFFCYHAEGLGNEKSSLNLKFTGKKWWQFWKIQKEGERKDKAEKKIQSSQLNYKENPTCNKCGTVYNRFEVIKQLKSLQPEIFDFMIWTTKFKCVKCGQEIFISGNRGE